MAHWIPSIPYPPPDQEGYWQPVTSTLQWCEEDYYATYYSAEIVNTLTNLMFWYCAWKGIQSCRRNGHDKIFEIAYYGYLLVAAGSFMFHTTLKYPFQLVDELNMIYTTCLMIYANLSYARSIRFKSLLGLGCVLFCAFITAYYHYLQDPVFHQNVYAAMTIWLVFRSGYQMETLLRPRWRGSLESDRLEKKRKGLPVPSQEQQEFENKTDLEILNKMWLLVLWGISVFLTGFAFWGIDNLCCGTLRRWRRNVGLPWGMLFEFHGWWHIFTGYGAYCYIIWGAHLRHILNGDHRKYEMRWPRLYSLPELVRHPKSGVAVNGQGMNGYKVNGHHK